MVLSFLINVIANWRVVLSYLIDLMNEFCHDYILFLSVKIQHFNYIHQKQGLPRKENNVAV